jgi:spermidine synthase
LSDLEHKWFIEYTTPHTGHMFSVSVFLKSFNSKFQKVEIADTPFYGRLLILDGKIQSAAYDEYIYHEALVHPAMLLHPHPRRVLVIGGGEGATLREVFRHACVERVVMVDIDAEVVELCREYLGQWHQGSFDDPRLELLHLDARQYLEENEARYDVIISDLPEPVEEGPSRRLFTRQFYGLVKDRLSDGGILALQAGDFSIAFMEAHSAIYNTIRQVMPGACSYHAYVSSFNTDWSFVIASRDANQGLDDPGRINERIAERRLNLRYYDEETHQGMFAVPRDIRLRRDAETRVIDDDNLLTIY